MLILTCPAQLQRLEGALRRSLPLTLPVYGAVMNINRGNPAGLEVVVDAWPEFGAVLARRRGEVPVDDCYRNTSSVFYRDVGAYRALLETPGCLRWDSAFHIIGDGKGSGVLGKGGAVPAAPQAWLHPGWIKGCIEGGGAAVCCVWGVPGVGGAVLGGWYPDKAIAWTWHWLHVCGGKEGDERYGVTLLPCIGVPGGELEQGWELFVIQSGAWGAMALEGRAGVSRMVPIGVLSPARGRDSPRGELWQWGREGRESSRALERGQKGHGMPSAPLTTEGVRGTHEFLTGAGMQPGLCQAQNHGTMEWFGMKGA
uniref:Glycine N-acyltransferase-like protein n=1 Tax=Amazona collaria TaxID=241587 RepID=A0A8B9FR83_9PSIT